MSPDKKQQIYNFLPYLLEYTKMVTQMIIFKHLSPNSIFNSSCNHRRTAGTKSDKSELNKMEIKKYK